MNLRHFFYFFTLLLYVSTALNSYGFDDEFFNIILVERYGMSAFSFTQTMSVHPPLSYLINAFLYEVFDSWVAVRVVSAVALCAAFFYVGECVFKKYGHRAATLTFLLLASNPALLLWGTSIRWYAYFLPVLLWLCITPNRQGVLYWAKLSFGIIILGYTGYIAFLIAPAMILLYWLESGQRFESKLKYLIASLIFALTIYAPQLLIFLTVHLPNGGTQISSIFNSIAGVFITQFSNQGVFTISIPGLVGAIGFMLVMTVALISQPISIIRQDSKFISYALFTVLAVVSGISGKFRNLVILSPLQAIWLGSVKIKPRAKRAWIIGLCLVFVSNFWGLSNVYFHKNTTKNSWNLPIAELLTHLSNEVVACDGSTVFFTHDPTISYYVDRIYINSVGPYMSSFTGLQDRYRCGFIITTFQGSIPDDIYSDMMLSIESLGYSNRAIHYLNEDLFYAFKNRLDSRYPRYGVTITKFEDLDNVTAMESWLHVVEPSMYNIGRGAVPASNPTISKLD
jgi:hypothetical protein